MRAFAVGGRYMFLAVAEGIDASSQVDIYSSIYTWDGTLYP